MYEEQLRKVVNYKLFSKNEKNFHKYIENIFGKHYNEIEKEFKENVLNFRMYKK